MACTPQKGGGGVRFALRKKGEMWLSLRNGGCDLHPVKRGEEVKIGGGGYVAYTP